MGLALVLQLVKQHGGALDVHSDGLGQGSEFVVTLPLCSELDLSRSPAEPKRITEGPSRMRRILVVDDNPDIADSFKVLLETMGHQVRVLNAGSETLAAIRELRPEVVFLDICMPDMDGCQVAAGIRAAGLYPRPMLVALTGYGRDSDRETALESGFDHHLLKPAVPVQIEALLAELD